MSYAVAVVRVGRSAVELHAVLLHRIRLYDKIVYEHRTVVFDSEQLVEYLDR